MSKLRTTLFLQRLGFLFSFSQSSELKLEPGGHLRLPPYKVFEHIQKAKCSLGSTSCLESIGSIYLSAPIYQYLYSYFSNLLL